MKPTLILVVIACTIFSACKPKAKSTNQKNITTDIIDTSKNFTKLLGSYVGAFGDNKINLLISKSTIDSVEGRTVVGGNDRPFSGDVKLINGKYIIHAKEPGDDKNDGVFEISIDQKNDSILSGNWKPQNATTSTVAKNFTLQRRAFIYLKDVGKYPQASKIILKDEDVQNLGKDDLATMRNEIFARHGYCFKKKNLRQQFDNKDWYIPNNVDVKNDLTDIEKKNIVLIKHFEKYADEYGDDYGR